MAPCLLGLPFDLPQDTLKWEEMSDVRVGGSFLSHGWHSYVISVAICGDSALG